MISNKRNELESERFQRLREHGNGIDTGVASLISLAGLLYGLARDAPEQLNKPFLLSGNGAKRGKDLAEVKIKL